MTFEFSKPKWPKGFSYEAELGILNKHEAKLLYTIETATDPNQIAECQSFLNRISYEKYRLDQLDKEFS